MYEALHAVGIKAEITGRNDLEVEGKKISEMPNAMLEVFECITEPSFGTLMLKQ